MMTCVYKSSLKSSAFALFQTEDLCSFSLEIKFMDFNFAFRKVHSQQPLGVLCQYSLIYAWCWVYWCGMNSKKILLFQLWNILLVKIYGKQHKFWQLSENLVGVYLLLCLLQNLVKMSFVVTIVYV